MHTKNQYSEHVFNTHEINFMKQYIKDCEISMFKERKVTDQHLKCHLSSIDLQKSLRHFQKTVMYVSMSYHILTIIFKT